MKKEYISPQAVVTNIAAMAPLAGSGPGADEMSDPSIKKARRRGGRRSAWEDDFDDEEENY